MKATTNLLMTVLALLAFNLGTANSEDWRGQIQLESSQEQKIPGRQTTSTGFGGGQIGSFFGLGSHNLGPDLSIDGQSAWLDENGDLLFVNYQGQIAVTLTGQYLFSGTMTATGGTGRLALAKGVAEMSGTVSADLRDMDYEFEGTLNVPGNFEMSGTITFDGLECGYGANVQYSMSPVTGVLDVLSQSGSLSPTTAPQIDDSDPAKTVITFQAEQGINEQLGRPMHVIRAENGDIYASMQALVRIEVENQFGSAVKTIDARYTILGGTGIFENATGGWQATMTTKPSYGGGPVSGQFQFNGDIQLDTAFDASPDIRGEVMPASNIRGTTSLPTAEKR